MDDPSFYGFPTYDEAGTGAWVKAAQDCGGAVTTAAGRSYDADVERAAPAGRLRPPLLPGVGEPVRTVTCLYTLTPDRDFVVGPLPGAPAVLVGLGAGPRVQVRADAGPGAGRPRDDRRDDQTRFRRSRPTGRPWSRPATR